MRAVSRGSTAAAFGALCALVLGACGGYALVGRGSNIPEDVRSVYLAALENRTQRPQVEQFLTRALADELVRRGRFDRGGERGGRRRPASGSVVGFGATPVTFDTEGRATEYEISITARSVLVRLDNDEVVWSNDRYVYRENYPVDATSSRLLRPRDRGDRGGRRSASRRRWSPTCWLGF